MRIERIRQAQDEESWIANLKTYLVGDVMELNAEELKGSAQIANDYEVDESGLLLFCPRPNLPEEDRIELARLVVLELLQQDFLHHYIPVWRVVTKESVGHTIGSEQIFIGEVYTAVYSDMWESVSIVKPKRDVPRSEVNHLEICKLLARSRSSLWIISHPCRDLSKATPSY